MLLISPGPPGESVLVLLWVRASRRARCVQEVWSGGSEVALDVAVGIGGVGNNNDEQQQQHITARTTHSTHTYPKSILRNTHNTHTQSERPVAGRDDDDDLIEFLKSGVRTFKRSAVRFTSPT